MTIRVAHVIEAMHRGGAESLVVEHARLASPGIETLVVALNRGGVALEAAERAGAKTIMLAKGSGRLGGLRRLADLLARERVHVVNGHNAVGALYGTLAGRFAGVPAIVRTEHSIHYPGRHSPLYSLVLEPLTTALSSRVVCVCEASRASHVRRLGWARRRFVVVLNGISEASPTRGRDQVRAELGVAPEAPLALAVGSLTPQKAQDDLIQAFVRVREEVAGATLVVAGEGPLEAALAGRIRELGLENAVRLIGPRDDVADLMDAADVFVLSSVREGLSITLLEAMRAGRPAVVTDVGGNAEAVAHQATGLVVPRQDPKALGEALARLLGAPEHARRMGDAARARWSERFTAARMVAATEAIYRTALERRSSRETIDAEADEREGRHASA